MNEEGILSQIRQAPRDTYFEQHDPRSDRPDNPPDESFTLSDNQQLLLRDGRIYAPDHAKICLDILRQHHDHKLRGHPGIRKTLQLISRTYFWPGLKKDVTRY
ncbi:hypothetical protein C0992_001136, partial [Termitomyces sp. T32_za158]